MNDVCAPGLCCWWSVCNRLFTFPNLHCNDLLRKNGVVIGSVDDMVDYIHNCLKWCSRVEPSLMSGTNRLMTACSIALHWSRSTACNCFKNTCSVDFGRLPCTTILATCIHSFTAESSCFTNGGEGLVAEIHRSQPNHLNSYHWSLLKKISRELMARHFRAYLSPG